MAQSKSVKTSESHPLRVDIHDNGAGYGYIGMTFCPGKKGPSSFGFAWDRNVAMDINKLIEHRAQGVLTIMETEEMKFLGVQDLGEQVQKAGLCCWHLSVPDGGVLSSDGYSDWERMRRQLVAFLAGGNNLVIHCRGGLGRTGTFAAVLLMDLLNVSADEAMKRVRAVRKDTIERSCQEEFIHNYRKLGKDGYFGSLENTPASDKILGCLLGGAVGDAFGYAIEFDSLAGIRAKYGTMDLQEPVLEQGKSLISDDTQMTLFTAEGLLKACADAVLPAEDLMRETIHAAYRDWLFTQEEDSDEAVGPGLKGVAGLYVRRAPGNTCLSALRTGRVGTRQAPINDSKGCGGVMRVAPFGLMEAFSVQHSLLYAVDAAAITHGHASGYLSAGALAVMIRFVMMGHTLRDAAQEAMTWLEPVPGKKETVAAIEKALQLAESDEPATADTVERLGGGWIGEEALAISLYAALKGRDFKDVIRIAANHSGDSDSTASIAGQLYGAAHGISAVPQEWLASLELSSVIKDLAQRLSILNGATRLEASKDKYFWRK